MDLDDSSREGRGRRGGCSSISSIRLAAELGSVEVRTLFEGVHHTGIQIGSGTDVYRGTFAEAVDGGLAPAGAEGTRWLAGRSSLSLEGERVFEACSDNYASAIALSDPSIPEAFVQTIHDVFDLPLA